MKEVVKEKKNVKEKVKEKKNVKENVKEKKNVKEEVKEKNETVEAAKKIEADPDLKYKHPLMNCEMNLMEISHRAVEKIEKAKYRIVGKSEGDLEADKKEFAQILIDELIKFN